MGKYTNDQVGWIITCSILSVMFFILLVVYLYFSRNDFRKPTQPLTKASYITYILAVLFRSIGYACQAGILGLSDSILHERIYMFISSFPGYMTAAAYCIIFFSWCSICIECMEKKTTKMFERIRIILIILLAIIIVFFISIIIVIFNISQKHIGLINTIEAAFAIFRDIAVSVAFVGYLISIWKLFVNPCSFLDNYESTITTLCVTITSALIVRVISILVYSILRSQNKTCFLDSSKYLCIFIIEQLLSEFFPLGVICLSRVLADKNRATDDPDYDFRQFA
ncbi:hypothetical protein TRFO_05553 [Tritrichomonas foetus]|uniref:THH1/TOM1/TOM3 domain-containing protein n=1 Tax=Tritrichomonas foetus TaxID=1144522 RepID=A0A1J4K9Q3_9EUKA|nr:hypothetical protein TRFO_05553 [Tritrichomonas foetus]|eukprot:OHT06366.1 hypothetical protein TRFO_05553 [Tritrichomonas foetus]